MEAHMSKKEGAGRKASSGNVVLDLGEEVYTERRRSGMSGGASTLGRYRSPQSGFGFRPWHAGRGTGVWELGRKMQIPQTLTTSQTLTGAIAGTVGGRVVVRLVPQILGTTSRLAAEAVAFGVGLIPFLVQRNSMTAGIALPGLVFLTGALADFALDAVGMQRPVLAGLGESRRAVGAMESALAARQKLAEIQSRIRPPAAQQYAQQAAAYPRYAG
jgi:hypothetical protein